MRIIGLTGGIASGKSTVASLLRQYGAIIEDADQIYKELVTPVDEHVPSPLCKAINRRFNGVLTPKGELNRAKLGKIVFANAEHLRALGEITHPAVAARFRARCEQHQQNGHNLLFYDVPLFFERGLQTKITEVVVVWVPEDVQILRLMARDRIIAKDARSRIGSQLSLDDKRQRATWVIDNSGERDRLTAQVAALWDELANSAK